jgi:uncharacterized membrane protein YoaK (UPF0700 family)
MINKLPGWVFIGSVLLAAVAGFVNTVGLLGLSHPISHVTGNLTLLSESLVHRDTSEVLHTSMLVIMFFIGAVLCGFIVKQSTLRLGRRYGAALTIEAVLLFVAIRYLDQGVVVGGYLLSAAMGLQNGMVSLYSSAVVRTTHMTGVTTDLGVALGHVLRGMRVESRRFLLLGGLLGGFVAGGVIGSLCFTRWHYLALFGPAVVTGGTGIAYFIYRHRRVNLDVTS